MPSFVFTERHLVHRSASPEFAGESAGCD